MGQNVSTGEIQHMDQCFKRSFHIRVFAHECFKVLLLRLSWDLRVHLQILLPQGHLVIVETTTIKLRLQRKIKKREVKLMDLFLHSPNILGLMMIIYVFEKTLQGTPNCYIYFLCLETQGILHHLSTGFLYQTLWLQRFINIYICIFSPPVTHTHNFFNTLRVFILQSYWHSLTSCSFKSILFLFKRFFRVALFPSTIT